MLAEDQLRLSPGYDAGGLADLTAIVQARNHLVHRRHPPRISFAAPADVAWKSCALRNVFCDPRRVPNPTRQSRCGRALLLRVSRESEGASNETRGG
jgi:hypothetical protein